MESTLTASWMLGAGLVIGRAVIGTLMVAHAGQKLFGWLGGIGLRRTAGYFEQIGFRPGLRFVEAASLVKMTSGLLVALGLLGPVGPSLMISVMLVAAVSVHRGNGLFATTNGVEVPLLYTTGALAFAMVGFGPYSLDALLGIDAVWTPSVRLVVLALGVLVGIGNLILRRPKVSGQARALGLDAARVARELKAGTYAGRVSEDFRSGVRNGVNGTPTFFVNGVRYDGSWMDVESFIRALQSAAQLPLGSASDHLRPRLDLLGGL
jgi:putative oxidoreductase